HLVEERLETPLPQIPLTDAKADALAVEIARESPKTVGEAGIGLEGPGQCETALPKRLLEKRWRLNRLVWEECGPRLGTDHAIRSEGIGALKRNDGTLGTAAVFAVNRPGVVV